MSHQPSIAISIGDLNGIGFEIALRAHANITNLCKPHYFIDEAMATQAAQKLGLPLPADFHTIPIDTSHFTIQPGRVDATSGSYAYASFKKAVDAVKRGVYHALVTLPIHKEAWMHAGIEYKGHTDALRDFFKQDAIMMLGCEKLYVALFTEHIRLLQVAKHIEKGRLERFFIDFQNSIGASKIGVLGLNPHAGDHGVLGDEERIIEKAIEAVNTHLNAEIFEGPLVPDVAFTPHMRQRYRYLIAMYHDQGLAPLKALYFDESINVSLNLPIIRTSVDHGTAFDIAYKQRRTLNLKSYINAVKAALSFSKGSRLTSHTIPSNQPHR